MVNKEEFEDLFVFLTNILRDYGRIYYEYDQFVDDFYIKGNYQLTEFEINPLKGGLSLTLKKGDDNSEAYLTRLISQFKKEDELVSYTVEDSTGFVETYHIHEWTTDPDRIEELKNASINDHPLRITNIKYSENKCKKLRQNGQM